MEKRKVIRVSEVKEAIERLRLQRQPEQWGYGREPWEAWNDCLDGVMNELDLLD